MGSYLRGPDSGPTMYDGKSPLAPRVLPTDYISSLYSRISALQIELHHAKQHAADSARATQYLLHIQAAASPEDSRLRELRARNKHLEHESQSLRDQICFLMNSLDDLDSGCFIPTPASSFDSEHTYQIPHLFPQTQVPHKVDNGDLIQPLPPQWSAPVQSVRIGSNGVTLSPSPIPKSDKAIFDTSTIQDESVPLIDFGQDETAIPLRRLMPAPSYPKIHHLDSSPVQTDDQSTGLVSDQDENAPPIGIGQTGAPARATAQGTHWQSDNSQVVSIVVEDKTAIAPDKLEMPQQGRQDSVSFTSMMEGAKEWADDTPMPITASCKPVKCADAIAAPRLNPTAIEFRPQHQRPDADDSHHEPRHRTIERSPPRPAYARDENWIRWKPKSSKWQKSHRIIIENLPDNICAPTLLASVRGGLIIACQILDTTSITGSMSALIRFYHADDASAFVKHARKNPLIFNDTFDIPMRASVKLIDTPSFPLTAKRCEGLREHGHTRCLELRNFPIRVDNEDAIKDLRWFLRPYSKCKLDLLERVEVRGEDTLFLAFLSVDAAVQAHATFMSNPFYKNCFARFVEDPCSRPWEADCEVEAGEKIGAEKMNSDEIELESDADKDLDCESVVSAGMRIGLMTPPDSSDDERTKKEVVPARWDKAREWTLEWAALRRSSRLH